VSRRDVREEPARETLAFVAMRTGLTLIAALGTARLLGVEDSFLITLGLVIAFAIVSGVVVRVLRGRRDR
jgi:hypothetical protein